MRLKIKGGHTLIDDEDYDKIKHIDWLVRVKDDGMKYVYGYPPDGKPVILHRFLMEETRPHIYIDHRNGDGLDNQRSTNLRRLTALQNGQNKGLSKRNSTGWKGVSMKRGKYYARIMAEGKVVYLGTFNDPAQAGQAYLRAAEKLHGEFARQAVF